MGFAPIRSDSAAAGSKNKPGDGRGWSGVGCAPIRSDSAAAGSNNKQAMVGVGAG